MIASGGSIIETAEGVKQKGARHVYLITTFALFTEGIEIFDKSYDRGIFDKVYATNLVYVPEYIKEREWYFDVDCSLQIAEIINRLNNKLSLQDINNNKGKVLKRVKDIKEGK